jgi:hypothetical protein
LDSLFYTHDFAISLSRSLNTMDVLKAVFYFQAIQIILDSFSNVSISTSVLKGEQKSPTQLSAAHPPPRQHSHNSKNHQKQRHSHHRPRNRSTALIPTTLSLAPLELAITFAAVNMVSIGVRPGFIQPERGWWCSIVLVLVRVALEIGFVCGDAGVLFVDVVLRLGWEDEIGALDGCR